MNLISLGQVLHKFIAGGLTLPQLQKLDNAICLHPLHPWTWISHILYRDEFLFLRPLSSDHICSITSMESALPLALLLEMLDFLSKKQMNFECCDPLCCESPQQAEARDQNKHFDEL